MLTPTHPKMVDFTTNLISAAKYVKHIVKFSHIRADAQPGITITRLHRQAEKVTLDSRRAATISGKDTQQFL